MKKAISIFFILLANIAILAHAVVPHHHHNKVFAAIVNVLDDDLQNALNHPHDDNAYSSHSKLENVPSMKLSLPLLSGYRKTTASIPIHSIVISIYLLPT